MKNNDLISIIIPVYNASRFLPDTIESIQSQTYDNWEAIFVNDCSIDNSTEIIKKIQKNDKRIKLINNEVNSGPALTRNKGILSAKGDYLCFLDADDLWDNDKLEKQLNFMKKIDCAFSFTSYQYCNEKCERTGKKVVAPKSLKYHQALKNTTISTITVMFDLHKLDKQLLMMPNIMYIEDTATWWKILRTGIVAYGSSDVFSYYRRSKSTLSSNKFRTLKSLWYVYRKEEKLNFIYALYCFAWKNIKAILRRI